MISYKDAGVDIDAGNSFVEGIKPFVKSTLTPNVIGGIGSFSGAFRLPAGYNKPTQPQLMARDKASPSYR